MLTPYKSQIIKESKKNDFVKTKIIDSEKQLEEFLTQNEEKIIDLFDNTFRQNYKWPEWLAGVNDYYDGDTDYKPSLIRSDSDWANDLIKDFFYDSWKQQWGEKEAALALDIFTNKRVPTDKELKTLGE